MVAPLIASSHQEGIPIQGQDLLLWYDEPASVWTEAVPIGNGYLGAMIFGGPQQDHLQLNETTLYSGDPNYTYQTIRPPRKLPGSDAPAGSRQVPGGAGHGER